MRYAYHGGTTLYSNLSTDISLALDLGYDSIEPWTPKVLRYLDAGYTSLNLVRELGALEVPMLDVIVGVERTEPDLVVQRLTDCSRLAQVAADLDCPAIQVVATDSFHTEDWPTQRQTLISHLIRLSDLTAPHGVRLAIEPLVYSPFNTLDHALDLIDAVGTDRVGLCLDTWHLWAAGESWDRVAALDPALILSAQLSDTLPRAGAIWRDDVRAALPGDGILPLADAVAAIEATGYQGHWCVEMLSARHREWDTRRLATELRDRLHRFVKPLPKFHANGHEPNPSNLVAPVDEAETPWP